MATFFTQVRFTDKGIQAAEQSPQRAAAFRQAVEKAGGAMIAQYWAMGDCDGIAVFSVANEATAAGLLLALTRLGFVRTSTIRLLDEQEFRQALAAKT